MSSTIHVSIRELHARTGHYLRKVASQQRLVVTDDGQPLVQITALDKQEAPPYFSRRKLTPAFKKAVAKGLFNPKATDRHSTELVSDNRDEGY